ncbi:hypothetical protein LP419_38355 [Massilia sp. H-1]|nr:hypothetical protein LP419_38355 [Massilia sp. H-1]
MSLSLTYCMLFGALISPTDPIAVMGILEVGARLRAWNWSLLRRIAVQRRGRRGRVRPDCLSVLASGATPDALSSASLLLLREAMAASPSAC